MPYIIQEKRNVLNPHIDGLLNALRELECDDPSNNTEGNLNYVITCLLFNVYGDSYRDINDAMGMMLCAALEYYRKRAAPYEDQKEFENGPVRFR